MDVEDVSNIGQWMQLLQKQQVALQAASKRQGERPKDRKSHRQLIREFMPRLISTTMMPQMGHRHFIHQSWVGLPYPPSVAPLETLKRCYLNELRLETHHRGFYLLLRAVTPPNTMTAVMAIVEDERYDGVMFQLFQQEDDGHRQGDIMVQKHHVFIVKEPYYKIMNDGDYGLRVDHVSDVIWLSPDDERIPLDWQAGITEVNKTAVILKEEGNLALKHGKLREAAELYTSALRVSTTSELSRILRLNRALTNLKLGLFDRTLEDVGNLVLDEQPSEKGLYRAAMALYGLERFEESHVTLQTLIRHYPECDLAKKEIVRTSQRLQEEEHGIYDFGAMQKAAKKTPPCLDNATFTGNVQIQASKGRGRGLFTTKNVNVGELLLCEKAITYCSSSDRNTSLLMNTHTNHATFGTQAELITVSVQKFLRNPSLATQFFSLYHGDYKPVDTTEVDGSPIIDTFLVERIISLNVFGCPNTSLESHPTYLTPQKAGKKDSHHTTGIFIKASHINHSCYGNARRSFIGDMQIVRATCPIPAGAEIFFCYVRPGDSDTYDQRQEKFKHWGFRCTCTVCEHSKKMKKNVLARRVALLNDLSGTFDQTPVNFPLVERTLKAIEKTYPAPASEVPRLALWDPYLLLTRFYTSMQQPNKAVETAWKVIASLGFVIKREDPQSLLSPFEIERWGLVDDCLVQAWVHLWTAYAKLAPLLCGRAEEMARVTYKICVGEDDTFEDVYGKLAKKAMSEGLDLAQAFQGMRV
ncbi:MAG: hypothetical protein Q9219_004895 [cf. Caloplaca sp. 3 TL-2023]